MVRAHQASKKGQVETPDLFLSNAIRYEQQAGLELGGS